MAWRFRLNTKRYYLDFEWGKPQEQAQLEQAPMPAMNDQPLVTYVEPLGFRLSNDGGFSPDVEV